jgi:hypothetical protein
MKKLILILSVVMLSGCSTINAIKDLWPRAHDPAMFDNLVSVSLAVDHVDCEKADWTHAQRAAEKVSRYAEWRQDPQTKNLQGLLTHIQRLNKGGSKVFCELGKKTAAQRIQAAKTAWEGR